MIDIPGFLAQILEAYEDNKPLPIVKWNYCQICKVKIGDNETHCSDCLLAIKRGYQISELTGRCRTGSDATGTRWHARLIDNETQTPNHKALCGYTPKGLSAGWSTWKPAEREVTCPKCLKKLLPK